MSADQPVLRVSRSAFRDSLRRLQRAGKSSSDPVRLEWEAEALVVSWNDTTERMPAQGNWPQPVWVSASWLRTLAKSLPDADPLTLRLHDGRLYAGNYSRPVVDPEMRPASAVPPGDRDRRLKKAATLLKPFRVEQADLEALVSRWAVKGASIHPPEEERMLKRVADAWVMLAPFGVEVKDLYELVRQRIRMAWK
jgi:hypothetical protein